MTPENQFKHLARFRMDLIKASGEAAAIILNQGTSDESFSRSMRILGEITGVSRVYYFEVSLLEPARPLACQRYEWCAAGIEPQIDNPLLQEVDLFAAGYTRWVEEMQAHRTVHGHIRDFPVIEQPLLSEQNILSLAVTPVHVHGVWSGFLGFDACLQEVEWTEEAVACLELMGRVFGAAIERHRAVQQSLQLQAHFEQLVENLPETVFSLNAADVITYLSPAWEKRFGWNTAGSLGQTLEHFLSVEDRPVLNRACADLRRGRQPEIELELRLQASDLQQHWISLRAHLRAHSATAKDEITGLITDINEQKMAADALRDARIAAEAANRAKSEFLAIMSHELRTPLNSVLGLSESLLESSCAHSEREKRYLQTIHRSGRHLLELINDILDLARAESGRIEPNFEVQEVVSLCANAAEVLRSQATARRITLDAGRDASPVLAEVDPRLLRQIVLNLTSNAIKFTPPEGRVQLRVERSDHRLTISVRDSGIGIPAHRIEDIFKPFVQLDTSLARKHGGTGLGLTLVDRLVKMMDGTITCESVENQGSLFVVSLPRTRQVEPPVTATVPLPPRNHSRHVLLVDDDEDHHVLTGDALQLSGFRVSHAHTGDEALRQLQQEKPGLILTDIQMAPMNGLELIRQIRQRHGTELPIIALTALAMPEEIEACRQAGANE